MKLLFLITIIISCASAPQQTDRIHANEEAKKNLQQKVKEVFKYTIQNVDVFNGKIKYVNIDSNLEDGPYKVICKNKKRKHIHSAQIKNKKLHFYLSESYFSRPHNKKCFLEGKHILNVSVKAFKYKKERLNVPKRKVDLNKKDLARVIREKKIKKHIYDKSADYYLFDKAFNIPLKSKITSYYGNQRVFNDKKKSQHLGNDLRAAIGLPVKANNRGQVVFTGNLFFSGGIVVIDHGLDLFTVYMHLSKILVKKGTVVQQHDVIGHAGMTGRVSGPHLHWGVRLNGNWLDGFTLVEESKKHIESYELEE